MNGLETVSEYEQKAEAAYTAMYEVRPHKVTDCFDDARLYFAKAIEAAQLAELPDVAARLAARLKSVEQVYNGQFRGVGR